MRARSRVRDGLECRAAAPVLKTLESGLQRLAEWQALFYAPRMDLASAGVYGVYG